MDPDEALKKLRQYMARDGELDGTDVFDLCETFKGLDGWLSKKGFLPKAWSRPDPRDDRMK